MLHNVQLLALFSCIMGSSKGRNVSILSCSFSMLLVRTRLAYETAKGFPVVYDWNIEMGGVGGSPVHAVCFGNVLSDTLKKVLLATERKIGRLSGHDDGWTRSFDSNGLMT